MAETNFHPEKDEKDESVPLHTRELDGLRCDFCDDVVMRVRRIVIDGDYERLQTRHLVRYACESCSDEKERRRLGLAV